MPENTEKVATASTAPIVPNVDIPVDPPTIVIQVPTLSPEEIAELVAEQRRIIQRLSDIDRALNG